MEQLDLAISEETSTTTPSQDVQDRLAAAFDACGPAAGAATVASSAPAGCNVGDHYKGSMTFEMQIQGYTYSSNGDTYVGIHYGGAWTEQYSSDNGLLGFQGNNGNSGTYVRVGIVTMQATFSDATVSGCASDGVPCSASGYARYNGAFTVIGRGSFNHYC